MTTAAARSVRVAYLDLANGVSGDMTLACLAHAGRRCGTDVEEAIVSAVATLPLDVTVDFVDDERSGISCLRAEVKTTGERHTASQLRDAIGAARLTPAARSRALRALDELVRAEAVVHDVDPSQVHLHELASADTAADLVGAAAGFDALDVERVACAAVPVPAGWISAGHGVLPVPAPATLEILRGARLLGRDDDEELVTPSGAAILVAHGASYGPLPELVLEAVGVGAGGRVRTASGRPNICRVLIGTTPPAGALPTETCVILEANIDDQTPETLGHAIETLVADGALDAWVEPIVMKKSRPAFKLCVLVSPVDEPALTEAFFRYTTTLGVRRRETTRSVLDREEITVEVEGIDVRVKLGRLDGDVVTVSPEYEDCARVAEATGLSLRAVLERATRLAGA